MKKEEERSVLRTILKLENDEGISLSICFFNDMWNILMQHGYTNEYVIH